MRSNIIQGLLVLILIVGLIIGVLVVQKKVLNKPKATLGPVTVNYSLTSGWNYIGLPFDLTNPLTPANLLSQTQGKCLAVAEYLPPIGISLGGYKLFYGDGRPNPTPALDQIFGGKNYFVWCSQAVSFSLSGNSLTWDDLLTSTSRMDALTVLRPNYNYFFTPLPYLNNLTSTPQLAADFFTQASTQLTQAGKTSGCVSLYQLNNNTWQYYSPSDPSTVNFNLDRSKGYVLMCNLLLSTPSPSPLISPSTALTRFGIQVDISSQDKIPNSNQLLTMNPTWVRFVAHYNQPLPSLPSNIKKLVIFNHESLDTTRFWPFGKECFEGCGNSWKDYIDNGYLPSLENFVRNNPGIDAVEIWNEEDICDPGGYCPKVLERAYAYMLKASAARAKNIKPDIKIIMGGLGAGQIQYVHDVNNAESGVFDQVEAIGLHPYGRSPNGWGSDSLPFGDLADFVNQHKNTFSKPVWVTEIGQGTTDNAWQAEYLRRSFEVLSNLQAPVVIWYAWTDNMGGSGATNWGLFDSNGSIKPSGNAFRSFNP